MHFWSLKVPKNGAFLKSNQSAVNLKVEKEVHSSTSELIFSIMVKLEMAKNAIENLDIFLPFATGNFLPFGFSLVMFISQL